MFYRDFNGFTNFVGVRHNWKFRLVFPPLARIYPSAETWPSGRRRSPAKGVGPEGSRGFESLRLRHIPLNLNGIFGLSGDTRQKTRHLKCAWLPLYATVESVKALRGCPRSVLIPQGLIRTVACSLCGSCVFLAIAADHFSEGVSFFHVFSYQVERELRASVIKRERCFSCAASTDDSVADCKRSKISSGIGAA